jgi:hypothetical protein
MKKILIASIFFSIMACSNNVNAQDSKNNLFDGIWVGQGYQLNNNETWSIVLIMDGDDTYIQYPSIGCEAVLEEVQSDGNKLFLTEKLLGESTCVDGGIIQLEWISPDELIYKWSFSTGEPGSFAKLIKF